MLVIRRRPGESLLIGENVEVEILESSTSQVKVGIRAPREIAVVRKEIHLTMEENRAAARTPEASVRDVLSHLKKKSASKVD